MTLKIKNWHQFQHFKDRKPPWIKLYRDLLDDIVWHQISGEDAKTLIMLWLIASENDGILPEFHELAFRLRTTQKSIKSTVSRLSHWLIQDDIKLISDITAISARYQNDALETETETETEREKERETKNPPPDGVDTSVWQDFLKIRKAKKSPMTATSLKGIEKEAVKAGMTLSEAITACCEFGWATFNAGWYAERVDKKVTNVVGVETFRERDQKAKRAQMERDFPNLFNQQEKNNVPSITLG